MRLLLRTISGAGATQRLNNAAAAEPDHGIVPLIIRCEELRETCGATDHKRQHPGSKWIECAEMADTTRARDPAHAVHYVVGSPALRLIDDNDPVHAFNCSALIAV